MSLLKLCKMIALLGPSFSCATYAHAATDGFLCIPDRETGFHYDTTSKTWLPAVFNPMEKYIVRQLHPDEVAHQINPGGTGPIFGLFLVGSDYPLTSCQNNKWPTADPAGSPLVCKGADDFFFNLTSLRFMLIQQGSYVTPTQREQDGDTPAMTIGKCSRF